MSPWRVALFSILGMTAAALSVYTLTPPPQAVAPSNPEPPPLDEPLESPPRAPTSTRPSAVAELPAPLPEPRSSSVPSSPSPTPPTRPRPLANQAPTFATPPQAQQAQPPQQFATPPDPPGTLFAATAGTCDFAIDGLFVGSGASIRQPLQPGPHTVRCTVPPNGASRVLSVTIKSNETATVLFKF